MKNIKCIYGKLYPHQKPVQSEWDNLAGKLKDTEARISLLECQSLSLYEDFADDRITKDNYIAEKAKNSADLEKVQSCAAELERQINSLDSCASKSAIDESLLQIILKATELSDEVLSLTERIIVFYP